MSTYIVVPKREIPDDILDGLINSNKIYDGPLASFYGHIKKTITQLIAKNNKTKEELSAAVESKDFKQLRAILTPLLDSDIDNIFSFGNNVLELEDQENKLKTDLPNVNIVSSSISSITISLNKLRMAHKDLSKSDFWELNWDNPQLVIQVSTQGNKVFVSKIICSNFLHPYAGSDRVVRLVGAELLLGENFIYDAISYSLNYLKMFREDRLANAIETYIGKKCSVTGVYTYGKGVTCSKTKDHLLKDEARHIDGRYYTPKVVKKCSKCEKESVTWTSVNKVIVCGGCNDIT